MSSTAWSWRRTGGEIKTERREKSRGGEIKTQTDLGPIDSKERKKIKTKSQKSNPAKTGRNFTRGEMGVSRTGLHGTWFYVRSGRNEIEYTTMLQSLKSRSHFFGYFATSIGLFIFFAQVLYVLCLSWSPTTSLHEPSLATHGFSPQYELHDPWASFYNVRPCELRPKILFHFTNWPHCPCIPLLQE